MSDPGQVISLRIGSVESSNTNKIIFNFIMAAWINAVQINHLGKLKNVVHFTTNVVSAMARNGKSFVKFWCTVLKLAFKPINHLYNAALVGAAWQHHPSKRGFVRMAVDFYYWPSNTFIQFCVSAPYANISLVDIKF